MQVYLTLNRYDSTITLHTIKNINVNVVKMDTIIRKYEKAKKDLNDVNKGLQDYPRGYLRRRLINNGEYYYLQYREGKQVRSIYVSPDKISDLRFEIEERNILKKKADELERRIKKYEKILNIHSSYRPVNNVDYEDYTLFMSTVAHDYKSLEFDAFIEKYDVSKYRGINKRYLAGFYDYINGIDRPNTRKTNDLVLDPYTYLMYFKYGEKETLEEELKKAIPAFLSRGLLITSVQEAVSGAYSN